MTTVRRSLFFSFSEKAAVAIVNVVTMATLARLFTPAELGTVAIAFSINMVLQTIREFGVGPYLIQKPVITRDDQRAVFTVSLAISAAVAGALVLISGPVAAYYGDPALREIIRVSALGAMVMPFFDPVMGMLRRDMAFSAIARINVASAVVNLTAVLLLSLMGMGVVAMVWAGVAAAVAAVIGAALCRPRDIFLAPTLKGCRRVLSFGGYSSAASGLAVATQYLPQMVIGSILGMAALGLVSRAMAISRLFDRLILDALQPVLLPALAGQQRSGTELEGVYLRALTLMTGVSWPFLVTLAILAEPVVLILLGRDWMAAVPLVQLMVLSAIPLFPVFLTQPLLVAVGRVRDVFWLGALTLPLTVGVMAVAARFGVEAAAAAGFVAHPLQVALALSFIRRRIPFAWSAFAGGLVKSALVTACTAASALAVAAALGKGETLWMVQALAVACAAGSGWLAGLLALRHPLAGELQLIFALVRRGFAHLPPAQFEK